MTTIAFFVRYIRFQNLQIAITWLFFAIWLIHFNPMFLFYSPPKIRCVYINGIFHDDITKHYLSCIFTWTQKFKTICHSIYTIKKSWDLVGRYNFRLQVEKTNLPTQGAQGNSIPKKLLPYIKKTHGENFQNYM